MMKTPQAAKPPDSEKLTINLGFVDLGQIELLVQEGFYSNRSDFIRTAIRNQIDRHADTVRSAVRRRSVDLGLRHITSADLLAARAAGERLEIRVLGLAVIAADVTPDLARDTIASLRQPGRVAQALGSLFGLHRPNKLANPRLEVLRRIAVFVWRQGWKVPKSELQAFLAEGFTLDQYELIHASIAKRATPIRRAGRGR